MTGAYQLLISFEEGRFKSTEAYDIDEPQRIQFLRKTKDSKDKDGEVYWARYEAMTLAEAVKFLESKYEEAGKR